jgi:hypothetical protein
MSVITKSMLRQTSLIYRVSHLNIIRQTLLPFSTSVRYLAESTNKGSTTIDDSKSDSPEHKSFDSIRK